MRPEERHRYIVSTEQQVVPATVALRVQGSGTLRRLPRFLQQVIIDRGSKTEPYMTFVVEPYATFLAFEITDTDAATKLLPSGYELCPSAMFEGTDPRPCAIVSAFTLHTSVFWGDRYEFYLIAENTETGMLSWVIVQIESSTISYEPNAGFTAPSTGHSVVTTSYAGEVIVDMASVEMENGLRLVADLTRGERVPLDQRLWVEGNLSVDYGGDLASCTKPFSLVFDPGEMATALKLPLDGVRLCENGFGTGMLDTAPFEVACFPYAQHFVTTSYPTGDAVRSAEDLERSVREMTDEFGDAG